MGPGGIETSGTLDPDDPAFEGLASPFTRPVEVEGRLRGTEGGSFLWRARVQAAVAGECRRCLAPVEQVIDEPLEVIFSPDPELQDDPSVYAVPPNPVFIDLAQAVREEVTLRASAFPLCREACQGLCPRCGADLNAGPCRCATPDTTN
jgi:uncharacterized protein